MSQVPGSKMQTSEEVRDRILGKTGSPSPNVLSKADSRPKYADGGGGDGRPAGNASTAEWLEFRKSDAGGGYDPAELEGLGRDDLVALDDNRKG